MSSVLFLTVLFIWSNLQWPDDLSDLFEMRVLLVTLDIAVQNVFNADDPVLSEQFLNQVIISDGQSLRVFLQEASLPYQVIHHLLAGVPETNVVLHLQDVLHGLRV